VQNCGLGGTVAVCALFAQCSDTDACNGSGDDDTGGRVDRSSLAKEGSESASLLSA
jgi:hypothetical protein